MVNYNLTYVTTYSYGWNISRLSKHVDVDFSRIPRQCGILIYRIHIGYNLSTRTVATYALRSCSITDSYLTLRKICERHFQYFFQVVSSYRIA